MSSAHRPSSTLKNRSKLTSKKFNPSNTAPVASAFNKEIIKHKVNIANKLSTTTSEQRQKSGSHSNSNATSSIDVNPTRQYETDINVANWQSESKRSFHPLDKSQVDYSHPHHLPASGNPLVRDPVYDADMWQSEYKKRCATLRQRQSELLASADANSEQFTAGVRSAPQGAMPHNYAWDAQNDTQGL